VIRKHTHQCSHLHGGEDYGCPRAEFGRRSAQRRDREDCDRGSELDCPGGDLVGRYLGLVRVPEQPVEVLGEDQADDRIAACSGSTLVEM
jgi:hypothetical protein